MHRVLFANGVRLARAGDLANATPQIATAYLLDSRCNIFAPVLPDDIDAESKNFILDGELLLNLIHHDTTSFGCDILHIILALHLGSVRGVDINGSVAGGQEFIAIAMVRIDKLITYLENHPDVEDPNCIIMGGCLTRKVLLYEKGTLRMGLGDFKNAMKDLSKALEIDEFYTKAREARACTWFGQNMKDDSTIHSEFIRILSENHVDNRGNEVAFAFLATSTLGNSSLGTYRDAKSWHDKMLDAAKRRDELYGKRRQDELPPIVQSAKRKFREYGNLDFTDTIAGVERVTMGSSKTKRSCLNCGSTESSEGGLSKCAVCKSAFYCSRKCQVKVRVSCLCSISVQCSLQHIHYSPLPNRIGRSTRRCAQF